VGKKILGGDLTTISTAYGKVQQHEGEGGNIVERETKRALGRSLFISSKSKRGS